HALTRRRSPRHPAAPAPRRRCRNRAGRGGSPRGGRGWRSSRPRPTHRTTRAHPAKRHAWRASLEKGSEVVLVLLLLPQSGQPRTTNTLEEGTVTWLAMTLAARTNMVIA